MTRWGTQWSVVPRFCLPLRTDGPSPTVFIVFVEICASICVRCKGPRTSDLGKAFERQTDLAVSGRTEASNSKVIIREGGEFLCLHIL